MAGVQSFVAQRHQSHQSPNRQNLGAQHRVPVPRTNLDNIEGRPSFNGPNAIEPASVPVARRSTHRSKQLPARNPVVHGGFDTDAEDFDDTASLSTGVSSRCYQGEEDDRDRESSRYVADTAVTLVLGLKSLSNIGNRIRIMFRGPDNQIPRTLLGRLMKRAIQRAQTKREANSQTRMN